MRYRLERLQTDVMARLGERARPQGVEDASGVPWPEDVVALKVGAYLAEAGSRILLEVPAERLGGGVAFSVEIKMRKMPCGVYAGEVRLPEGFIRLVSAKMKGWRRGVNTAIGPESAEWGRQWSAEPGIAGCAERPRAYLDSDVGGALLRLVGSTDESDSLSWLSGWSVPEADGEGIFFFPEGLYGELVGAVAGKL